MTCPVSAPWGGRGRPSKGSGVNTGQKSKARYRFSDEVPVGGAAKKAKAYTRTRTCVCASVGSDTACRTRDMKLMIKFPRNKAERDSAGATARATAGACGLQQDDARVTTLAAGTRDFYVYKGHWLVDSWVQTLGGGGGGGGCAAGAGRTRPDGAAAPDSCGDRSQKPR